MSEKILLGYKEKLLKIRGGFGKSSESEAKRISKNEALKIINECLENPESVSYEKVKEIRDRMEGLKENLHFDISPFKPSEEPGFYVRKIQDKGRVVYVELRGLTSKRPVLWLVQFMLKEAYDVKIKQDPENKYKGVIFRDEIMGDAFFVKGGGICIRLKQHKHKIFVRFWNEGFIVKCRIACPVEMKEKVLPKLRKMEEDYWNREWK
jgi:hypothetical protein